MSDSPSHILKDLGLDSQFHPRQHPVVWHAPQENWRDQLAARLEPFRGNSLPTVFFRADDIGAGGRAFNALCELFRLHGVPLELAVVPAWLSEVRKRRLFDAAPLDEPLWGWHQHGWRHVNWERSGKKSEFGEQRPFEKQWRDIRQGRLKMLNIFGEHLVSVFTPPWNRLSTSTLRILQELGFEGVSMEKSFPRGLKPPLGLRNLRIHLDLHTRKARNAEEDFRAILDELTAFLARKEPLGIMIHHQRMTCFAFEFLHELLSQLESLLEVHFSSFRELLEQEDEG